MYETEKTNSFSCASCGGRMIFSPEDQQLKCPYCGALKPFHVARETPNEYDIHFAPLEEDAAWGDATRVVRCDACGAELVLTGETSVKECPFCGSPRVQDGPGKAGIAPESLIAFQLTPKQAKARFRSWLRGRLFAPSAFRKKAAQGHIMGVYLSHWNYIDHAVSAYHGKEGRRYDVQLPVTVTDRDGKQRQETQPQKRTRWEPVTGTVTADFDDLMLDGSERLSEKLLSGVLPYHLSRLVRYSPEYIAGFGCEKPEVNVHEGWTKAQNMVDRRMAVLAREDILQRADEAQVLRLETEHTGARYQLLLLPMYMTAYTHRKRVYHVLVNGENGKVSGEAPVSVWRVLTAVLLTLAFLAGLYWLLVRYTGTNYMMVLFGGAMRGRAG